MHITLCLQPANVACVLLVGSHADTGANPHLRYKRDELEMIDNQGRCVITDHGAFVLFNVYGPAVTSELNERFAFKMRFYQVRHSSSQANTTSGVLAVRKTDPCQLSFSSW